MFEIAASDAPKWVAAVKEMTQRVEVLVDLRQGQHLHPYVVEQLEKMANHHYCRTQTFCRNQGQAP